MTKTNIKYLMIKNYKSGHSYYMVKVRMNKAKYFKRNYEGFIEAMKHITENDLSSNFLIDSSYWPILYTELEKLPVN